MSTSDILLVCLLRSLPSNVKVKQLDAQNSLMFNLSESPKMACQHGCQVEAF